MTGAIQPLGYFDPLGITATIMIINYYYYYYKNNNNNNYKAFANTRTTERLKRSERLS
jgi:hypothetical protein